MLKKVFLVVVLAIVLFFVRIQLYVGLQTVASYLCYPLIYLHYICIDPHKRSTQTLLAQAYEKLLEDYMKLQVTADLYDDIKELLDFKERYASDGARLVQIIERHMGQDEQYVLIDKGSRHGIHDRMVLVYKDMLVGRVYQVFPCYSKCILITDQRCKVGAYCAKTKAQGVTKGANYGDCIDLAHVSHLEAVEQDDIVISGGQGLIFPRGFGIVRITEFHKEDLLYQVSCRPLVDLQAITYCYVIEKC